MFLLNFLLAASTVVPNNQERPNIIVFLVDDMGLMDTSVPFLTDEKGSPVRHPLNEWYRTPNMERLANQGIRFSTFYAQSLSSPSRASILTGKNAARHRTTNWINAESNNRDKYGPFEWNWAGLTRDDCVYPLLLQKEGYRTIHVGKAHFGSKGSEGENPVNLGFDVNIAGSSIGHPGSYYGENGYGWIKGQRYRAVPDLEQYHGTNTFLSDALTLEAIKEIEKAVSKKQPFYLNLAHYAVHAPFEMDHRFSGNYNSPEKERHKYAKAFATLVEGMDKSLGDLMDKLEQLGIAQNTLIIFLGDNGSDAPLGGPDAYASSAPLRGQKGSEYEGGVRIPFIVGWAHPDKDNPFQKAYPVAQGSIQTQQGTIMDIYPTVLSVAGVRMPENYITDGADLKKLISGKKDPKHRNDFLMHYPHSSRGKYFSTYRKGDWKLIYYYRPEKPTTPSYKLFNLSEDPYEKKDLSTSNPSQVSKMFKAMKRRLEEENALYPVDEQGCAIAPRLIK